MRSGMFKLTFWSAKVLKLKGIKITILWLKTQVTESNDYIETKRNSYQVLFKNHYQDFSLWKKNLLREWYEKVNIHLWGFPKIN